jgi:hypothetical protein
MKSSKLLVGLMLLATSLHATAGWFTSDGSTFEECMENRRDEVTNPSQ